MLLPGLFVIALMEKSIFQDSGRVIYGVGHFRGPDGAR